MTFLRLIVCTKAEGTCYMTHFLTCLGQSHSSNNSQFLFQRPSTLSKWHDRKPLNNYIWTAWKCILSNSFLISHCWEVSPTASKSQRAEWTTLNTTKFLPQNTHKPCAAKMQENPFWFRVTHSHNRTSSKQTSSFIISKCSGFWPWKLKSDVTNSLCTGSNESCFVLVWAA